MMMRPPGFMCLSAACVATSAPRTLMSITRSISSSVVSSKGFGMAVPALFTSTSSRPKVATVFSTAPLTASTSAASAWIATAFPPRSSIALTTAPQPFVEPGHQTGGIDLKRGKHSMPPAGANADLDPTAAQLVQSAQVLREVNRAVQRGDEHDAAQAYPLGAGSRVAQSLQRAHERHRAERLLQRPGALEAERLGPRHVRPEASRIEFTVRNELRDGDRKSHVWLLSRRFR